MQAKMLKTVLSLALFGSASASWAKIAGYQPGSLVTSHNAVDLDLDAIYKELAKTTPDYTKAKNIYMKGGNSKPYAEFTVSAITNALSKGQTVTGTDTSGNAINTKMYANAAASATTIKVAYPISGTPASYADCKDGELDTKSGSTQAEPYKYTAGCFDAGQTITANGDTMSGVSLVGNKAGRHLYGFSSAAKAKMYTKATGCQGDKNRATDGCPYFDYTMYYNYYQSGDYANKLVIAALDQGATGFGNADADMNFAGTAATLRHEVVKKAAAYMSAYMYAIREFEDAIDDCNADCNVYDNTGCNSFSVNSVHAWDEGVAFYTGSLEGASAGGNSAGVMSYRVADKRCGNFKTCGANHSMTSGSSYANIELFKQLDIGQNKLLLGTCEEARPIVRKMVAIMGVPLIQGTLRYAYKVGVQGKGDKEKGEGAAFAAAIVPRVAHCNTADGKTIMDNMKIGAASTSFSVVKKAFEKNYACMNITCEEVGGLWFSAENKYYTGANPCPPSSPVATTTVTVTKTKDEVPGWGLAVIVVVAVLLAVTVVGFCIVIAKEKAGKPIFLQLNKAGGAA